MLLGLGALPDVAARARRVKAWTRGMGEKVRVVSGGLRKGRRSSVASKGTGDDASIQSATPELSSGPLPLVRLSSNS